MPLPRAHYPIPHTHLQHKRLPSIFDILLQVVEEFDLQKVR